MKQSDLFFIVSAIFISGTYPNEGMWHLAVGLGLLVWWWEARKEEKSDK